MDKTERRFFLFGMRLAIVSVVIIEGLVITRAWLSLPYWPIQFTVWAVLGIFIWRVLLLNRSWRGYRKHLQSVNRETTK